MTYIVFYGLQTHIEGSVEGSEAVLKHTRYHDAVVSGRPLADGEKVLEGILVELKIKDKVIIDLVIVSICIKTFCGGSILPGHFLILDRVSFVVFALVVLLLIGDKFVVFYGVQE